MKISDIINKIPVISSYVPEPITRRSVLSLCHDSRQATPTCAFFCKKGALSDGHDYAFNAYSNGARIFIAERELDLPDDAAVIITPDSSLALARMSVKFYNDPSKELKIIGITGTKGKTTVALSAYSIASSYGIKVGYIGTNGVHYNGKVFETVNTTPDVLELQKHLRCMRDDGVQVVFLEVSSQALWQQRTYGVKFHTVVFTNLYRDHIGGCEHPSFEHYRDCKKLLFSAYGAQNAVVNYDAPDAQYMLDGANCENIFTVSASGNQACSLYATSIIKMASGMVPGISFKCNGNGDISAPDNDVFIPIPGIYSAENGLLTMAICSLLGIDTEFIVDAMANLSVSGRFEVVRLECLPNSLFIIDYAHNGASLRSVMNALHEYSPKRIICLFGSVGGRTFERRQELGEVAAKLADVIIVTSDNPNNENPNDIINDINAAIGDTDKPVYLIADRKQAIGKAVEIAQDGDYILLAGKGHETYQLIHGQRVPFCEREILKLYDIIHSKY
jgi:UDP-N-acetylmuramoyl-L-alanyl-D-glutamate--2,6-diaminopimelate ligase